MKHIITFSLVLFCIGLSKSQNGVLEATNGVVVGDNTGMATDGTIRYDGTDFLGLKTGTWTSLTSLQSLIDLSDPGSTVQLGISGVFGNINLTNAISNLPGVGSNWDINSNGINYNTGNVGLGLADPASILDMNGDLTLRGSRRIDFKALGRPTSNAGIVFNGTDMFVGQQEQVLHFFYKRTMILS